MFFDYNVNGGRNMDSLLSMFTGLIITVMVIFNGQLSDYCGVYLSTVIIHLVGLVTFIVIMKIKKEKISFSNSLPLVFYCGGVIGIFTVIFNVFTVSTLGATLLTALGLLGQMITSLILEQKGWLGSMRKPMNLRKVMSLIVVMIGIGVMLL